ncbi:hypothetical protein MYX07_03140 [Patescibacteria group bacterium AH-259-L07]|nr:hypothetical protein [Patescibacteria group bacterium AH-259-L07]
MLDEKKLQELRNKPWDELIDDELVEQLKELPLADGLIYTKMREYFFSKYEMVEASVIIMRLGDLGSRDWIEIGEVLGRKLQRLSIVSDEEV